MSPTTVPIVGDGTEVEIGGPEGLVARKPTVHLNVRGKNEGRRLDGTQR